METRLRSALVGFVPGLLAGAQLCGLLFFLNPQWPLEPQTTLRALLVYGVGLALFGGAIGLAVGWRGSHRPRHQGAIGLTVVLAAAALSAWVHASYFGFFLPPGINRRLIKAAVLLSIGALVCFYTMLLHQLRNRRYSFRTSSLFVLIALGSIYVVGERRDAFRPPEQTGPRPTTFESTRRPLVFVVAIDTATLDAILPLDEHLPFFSRILEDGSYARVAALQPTLRSPSWATISTGQLPYRNGIVGNEKYRASFLGPGLELKILPRGIGFETWGTGFRQPLQVTAEDLQSLTLWQVLDLLDVPSAVIGWPLSSGSVKDSGRTLSAEFFEHNVDRSPPETATNEHEERARLFQTPVDELDTSLVSSFGEDPPVEILEALSGDLWRHQLARFFVTDQQERSEAVFLALPGLAEVSERFFGGYSSRQFDGSQEPTDVEASELVLAYYQLLDRFLAELWELRQEPRLLIVISPHGVAAPSTLSKAWRSLWGQSVRGSGLSSNPDGLLLMYGEGVRPGYQMERAELVDIVPTVLYGIGLPIARDLSGAVLTSGFDPAFLARQPLTFVPSFRGLIRDDEEIR